MPSIDLTDDEIRELTSYVVPSGDRRSATYWVGMEKLRAALAAPKPHIQLPRSAVSFRSSEEWRRAAGANAGFGDYWYGLYRAIADALEEADHAT
jgi:hypothetical protein